MAPVDAPRTRRTFARLSKALEVPNLIDIQKKSFDWLTDPESGGLRETIDDISPIEDYTGNLAVQFGEFTFDEPVASLDECREKDLTYARPLTVTVAFVNRETGEIREQSVFMGDFPWMTERGTFIINGTERVVVTQLVRSPGAYLMEAKDREKQVFIANLMPARGSWLELEIDKKGKVYVRIDRKRKLPVTVLLRAMGYASDEEILNLFEDSLYIRNTIESDTEVTKTEEGALIELFKKQRPGEPPSVDAARALLHQLFFDPKRYDLTRVGRYKLNSRLRLDIDLETRTLTHDDIISLIKELVSLPRLLGMPENPDVEIRDYAAESVAYPREAVADHLDEYEHFGNRRLRTVGELIQEAFRIGLYRMERVVRERLTTEDADTITPQTIVNIRPVVAALKEFFGSSQLSQFMDQNNSLSGLTHRRRLSALGAGGLTRERAPIEVRDVHPTHYGRMCPIETPEGPNIGLIGSLSSYAQISEHGFVTTPYLVVKDGKVTDEIVHLDATQEETAKIAQANTPLGDDGALLGDAIVCRTQAGQYVTVPAGDVDLMDVSPEQIWSVATAMIPFLEHDDANRALMGSNMQRQAVPLLKTDAPLVGTGMEYRAAVDSGDVVVAKRAGTISYVDADQIVIETTDGAKDEYALQKFMRSNQGTLIHQKPLVRTGQEVAEGEVLADGSSTDQGEMALGKNLRVAFMSWEGYNFEDAIILSKRLVKDDELTSIHIEEYEIDARTTKLGDEEITRDIPNRSEESLRNLDDRGIVRIGAEVGSGDLLVGKVTPKGETELTAEEKLIRAIFKEKAREVRDTSLKVPHGEGGVVIDVKTFSRDAGDDLPPGVNDLVRVFVAKKRKISEGDKLAGRHGNKGVISKIVDEQDMPFLEDGSPVDVILNPLGVPSRMNIGQILETHLGWAAAEGWYDDGSDAYQLAHGNGDGEKARVYVSTPVFDGATVEDVDNALLKWQEEHKGRIRMKTDPDGRPGTRASGKFTLFNGRTGEPFETQVTVGYMYILKLHHLVDDKIHARSTGPYSLVTQQPLGGKAQFGGQRFGEMEVWALEAYGAAYTLQEMLTIKSDDTVGRVKAYEAIVKGENIAEPSIPESFKVLLKEMQSLALDVNVVSEEGTRAEMREEDDDLLRAAEELGIDLSGVRATDGQAADEGTEGEDATDAEPEASAQSGEELAPVGEGDDELTEDEGSET
ncbi:DNA-directed RNA polymerase subunit beta [Conexibacter arvalis]|uniref:DNA-directed RNA polymerase subunit beta n=1 Tax=Conexibacter arvalis TaxID=912552 RepID=A0A840IG73_9ACTN|nr:DNA-directed RNA polymerase subunit beta [Conexibacter arvalis]MBB4662940.1 DNA-directed RNA polymerase subunit beta [Conexibacter arvalis]